jgi:tape measure domain-containing protein
MAATLDASLRLDSSQFTSGLDGAMKKTNASVSKMSAAFSSLKNIAVGGAIGAAFMDVAKSVTAAYLEAEKLQNALKSTAGNDLLGMAQYEQLKTLSAEIGVNMATAAKATLQLQAAGMSAAQSFKTIRTLQNAIASVGGGNEEMGRFIYGLQQLYASPKPLAEELGQLKEALPITSKLLTQAFGSARAEDLQKLNLTGKQVADTLLKAAEGLPKVARGLQGEIDGLAAKWESLKASGVFSAITLPAVGIASGTLDVFSRIGTEISDALNLMSGVDPAELRRRQADVIAGLEKEQKIAKEKADADTKALADKKALQEKLDKGNQENRELDAARWQWEAQADKEKIERDEKAQAAAKKAADQAISDAKELLSLHEDTVRKIKSVQEAVYSAQQSMAGSDAEKLTNAQKALEAEGDVLMGDDPGGFDALTKDQFEDAVKNGRNVTEGQVEQYNRIIGLKEEILGLEESITEEAKNGKAELRDQNREAVQRSIEKAGRTPAERKQEIRDNNDMQRQRRRAFNDDVRDEMTRLKKEAEEKNKGRNILDRERTDREAFKEAAKANIAKKWQDALPEAAQTLIDIKDILKGLAAA